MHGILKNILLATTVISLLYSCRETTGSSNGNDSIPTPASMVEPPSDALMTARLQKQLAGKYQNVSNYSEGMIAVMKDDQYGFCDSTGKEVIPYLYTRPAEFREGAACVTKDGKVGFIDKAGKELFPFRNYDYAGSFENGVSSFRIVKGGKELYGFVDKAGAEVVPPVYNEVKISWFGKSNAIVQKDGKWGTITKQNAVIIPFEYDEINDFNNGIATAKKSGKWGVIDAGNRVLVPFTMVYGYVADFESGYALVEKDMEHKGFIGTDGKEVFGGLRFREAFGFSEDGYAIVSEGGGTRYLIDKEGKPVLKGVGNDDISGLAGTLFVVSRNSKEGITDLDNNILLPIEYTSILPMGKNLLLVVKDSARYYADYKGNKVADYTEQ